MHQFDDWPTGGKTQKLAGWPAVGLKGLHNIDLVVLSCQSKHKSLRLINPMMVSLMWRTELSTRTWWYEKYLCMFSFHSFSSRRSQHHRYRSNRWQCWRKFPCHIALATSCTCWLLMRIIKHDFRNETKNLINNVYKQLLDSLARKSHYYNNSSSNSISKEVLDKK